MIVKSEAFVTDRQANYIRTLGAERGLDSLTIEAALEGLTKQMASQFIDWLLRQPKTVSEAPKPAAEIEEGFYRLDGVIYEVRTSKSSGKLYAVAITFDGERVRREYAPGIVRKLTPEHELTLDDAQAIGKLWGFCCICGRMLTNPESIENGIGPICAEKFGV